MSKRYFVDLSDPDYESWMMYDPDRGDEMPETDLLFSDGADWWVFTTEREVEKFLAGYRLAMAWMKRYKGHPGPKRKCLLLKRRWLGLVIAGWKHSTVRETYRGLRLHEEIYLYDQTYFVPVRITGISETPEGWKYDFARI